MKTIVQNLCTIQIMIFSVSDIDEFEKEKIVWGNSPGYPILRNESLIKYK